MFAQASALRRHSGSRSNPTTIPESEGVVTEPIRPESAKRLSTCRLDVLRRSLQRWDGPQPRDRTNYRRYLEHSPWHYLMSNTRRGNANASNADSKDASVDSSCRRRQYRWHVDGESRANGR